MFTSSNTTVKIEFDAQNCDISGVASERLWATKVGDCFYRLENSPFNIYGVSYLDVVEAVKIGLDLRYVRVHARSGHSTLRLRLGTGAEHSVFAAWWDRFKVLGCTAESSAGDPRRLYSLDVPPDAELDRVISVLKEGEDQGVWEYEEAFIAERR